MYLHATLAAALGLLLPAGLAAQTPAPEAAGAPVAVLATALYNDQANVREPSDSLQADIATGALRSRLKTDLGAQIIPYTLVDSLASSPAEAAARGGVACGVRVDCALAVGQATGARWVVMSKVSKTSNLIWLLSAQLIRVATGEIVLDDSTELKGEPGTMVRLGVRSFADRVTRTVRAGGRATNFPNGEPSLP